MGTRRATERGELREAVRSCCIPPQKWVLRIAGAPQNWVTKISGGACVRLKKRRAELSDYWEPTRYLRFDRANDVSQMLIINLQTLELHWSAEHRAVVNGFIRANARYPLAWYVNLYNT